LIHFICSDDAEKKGSYVTVTGKGNVCGDDSGNPDKPNILEQLGIEEADKERYEVHKIAKFDDFNECYIVCFDVITELKQKYPDADIIIDYTGGTKSMSAGLAATCFEIKDLTLCLVNGMRANLVKVQNGTENIRLTRTHLAFLKKQIDLSTKQVERYDYESAIAILEDCLNIPNIPDEKSDEIRRLLVFSKAYLAWDRFDHVEAWKLLNFQRKFAIENVKFLEAILWSKSLFDENFGVENIEGLGNSPKGSGYELIEDLVLNAERKAEQLKYDDAVGRLYRALELLVQMRLKMQYGLETGYIDLEKLPEKIRSEYEAWRDQKDNKIKIALSASYELLSKLDEKDELGKRYMEIKKKLLTSLSIRNNSLFAHGMTPISKKQYDEFYSIFVNELLDPFLNTVDGNNYSKRQQFSMVSRNIC
jgi:CRISPR-associated protein (TIGR02710 family)